MCVHVCVYVCACMCIYVLRFSRTENADIHKKITLESIFISIQSVQKNIFSTFIYDFHYIIEFVDFEVAVFIF